MSVLAKVFVTLLMTVLFSVAVSTTFVPMSFEDQVQESSAVAHVKYNNASFKRLPSGEVVTVHSFKILKSIGLDESEKVSANDFKVLAPGGKWQGLEHRVDGTPRFEPGEESVLVLDKAEFGRMFMNLRMGKYQVIKEAGKMFIKSDLFGEGDKFGKKISWNNMNEFLDDKFGEILVDAPKKSSEVVVKTTVKQKLLRKKKVRRAIASVEDEEEYIESNNSKLYILVIFFAILGAFSAYQFSKRD